MKPGSREDASRARTLPPASCGSSSSPMRCCSLLWRAPTNASSTNLMIKCMNDPLLQQHPLIQKACERPTYLKRTQAWPPKSAESLAKVPLTVDELCRFIAIEYYMGMVRLPSMVHHWSPLLLDSQVVKNIMSRDRFNAIKAMLSLESVEDTHETRDNNRHRKVGVWLDMFKQAKQNSCANILDS
mmetsp:Transcript_13397/g.52459  ORF Transcript_13397/g.52459 Transcript_13397/m.52459 type:complete len:185 (+) Transcript_13397:4864-5418(+)